MVIACNKPGHPGLDYGQFWLGWLQILLVPVLGIGWFWAISHASKIHRLSKQAYDAQHGIFAGFRNPFSSSHHSTVVE